MTSSIDPTEAPSRPALSGAQKAAVLLLCLSETEAARLLQRLPDAEVERVCSEMARICDVPSTLRYVVLQEFREMAQAEVGSRPEVGRSFAFLCSMEPLQLTRFLESEPPRRAALVLAHLPPALASQVLIALAPQKQIEVVRSIAAIQAATPAEVLAAETELKQRLLQDQAAGEGCP